MFEVDQIVSTICGKIPDGLAFEPSDINLTDYFLSPIEGDDEGESLVSIDRQQERITLQPITREYTKESQVTAIDSTSIVLGQLPDGLVGALRVSVITKPAGRTDHSLDRYGPYLVPVTNQNKDNLYRQAFKAVYGKETSIHAPDCSKTLDRIRNFFERYIQLEVMKYCSDNLVLLDGSLIGGTVADPKSVVGSIIEESVANRNSIVAISKFTGLTLKQNQKSILSILEDAKGPCYMGDIRNYITQRKDKYLGNIYVARLSPLGETFRTDIPENTPLSHQEIFNQAAGLAGEDGYPEELRLAHMTCVLSSVEIIELQSAAIALHGLSLKEQLRRRMFPL